MHGLRGRKSICNIHQRIHRQKQWSGSTMWSHGGGRETLTTQQMREEEEIGADIFLFLKFFKKNESWQDHWFVIVWKNSAKKRCLSIMYAKELFKYICRAHMSIELNDRNEWKWKWYWFTHDVLKIMCKYILQKYCNVHSLGLGGIALKGGAGVPVFFFGCENILSLN